MVTDADQGAEAKGAAEPVHVRGSGSASGPAPRAPDPPRRSPALRGLLRAAQVLAGLAVGCAIAEFAFSSRDGGAFPHLNVYVPDAELGVRLRPDATERVAFGPNPPTSVRINAQGFRGADWPAPGTDEILVVGDSQVFGLGVEETETMAAQLAALLPGKTVLNGGVPTYGPQEYAKVVAEVFARRKPKAVVFVVNFANDLFEAARPNKDRHTVWDGWAVHRESAPSHVTEFPGRELLYRRSHAFYALRRFWYERGPRYDDRAFAARRTWHDIALAGLSAEDEHDRAVVETGRLAKKHEAEVSKAAREAVKAQVDVDVLIAKNIDPSILEPRTPNGQAYRAAHASPGDIVGYVDTGEWEEPVYATAEAIRLGGLYREKLEQLLRDKAKRDASLGGEIDKSFQDREAKSARLVAVIKEPAPVVRAWSPVAPSLREVKALCDAHKARLLVVALPLDVQISKDEWKKYGAEPIDMTPADLLVADVVDTSLALGATPVDPTEALRAAEPGAFLHGDIHLTPKGHRALAEHVVKVMNEPPPLPRPKKGLPPGRSRAPGPKGWEGLREVTVRGSTAAKCETHMVREWLRVVCRKKAATDPKPLGIKLVEGGHGEAFATAGDEVTALLVPLLEGDRFAADFTWSDRTQRLAIQWKKGAQFPEMIFQKPSSDAPSATPPPLDPEPFCGCMKAREPQLACAGAVLTPSADCARTHGKACDKLLACMEGDPDALPTCPADQANAGAMGRCYPLCSDDRPCAAGICTEWQGGRVCM
jgi:hypothetical protein